MLNFQSMRLLHHHGDGNYTPMSEHTAESHDPERELLRGELRGARLFRCDSCADEVIVLPPSGPTGEAEREG